ncbi:hypothetical protein HDV01_004400 [Terramyces sp. JEL0728]|nr:hypothetical protein HDV01_004400 [Terramyces sp. JEL0728]
MDLFVPDKYSLPTEDLFSSTDLFDAVDHETVDFSIDSPKDTSEIYSQYFTNSAPTVENYHQNVKLQDRNETGEMGVNSEMNLVFKFNDKFLVFPKHEITEIKIKDLDLNYFNLYLGQTAITFEFADLQDAKTIKRFFIDDNVTLKELPIDSNDSGPKKDTSVDEATLACPEADTESLQELAIQMDELDTELQSIIKDQLTGEIIARINQAYRDKQEAVNRANASYLETIKSLLAKTCSLCCDESATKSNSD